MKEHTSILTDAGELTLSEQSYYEEAIGETAYNSYTDILYVLPDSICEKLLPVIKTAISQQKKTSPMKMQGNWKIFTEEYPEQAESGVMYGIRFSTLQRNSTIANNLFYRLQCFMVLLY